MANTCYNVRLWHAHLPILKRVQAVDLHVERGLQDRTAIIYDSAVTDTVTHISYGQLQQQVSQFAGALSARGVKAGDKVLIYMPMIPQGVHHTTGAPTGAPTARSS